MRLALVSVKSHYINHKEAMAHQGSEQNGDDISSNVNSHWSTSVNLAPVLSCMSISPSDAVFVSKEIEPLCCSRLTP
jgi:hypothetical protein